VDDVHIKKAETLFYLQTCDTDDTTRKQAYAEGKDLGYNMVVFKKNPIRIAFMLTYFKRYVLDNLISYIKLMFARNKYGFEDKIIMELGAKGLLWDIFLSYYEIEKYITISVVSITKTIIFNANSAQIILFQWSDLANYESIYYQYLSVNQYLIWGKYSILLFGSKYQIEKIVDMGFYGRRFFAVAKNSINSIMDRLPLIKEKKPVISFFDDTFDDECMFTREIYFEYLLIVRQFAKAHPNFHVLFKRKKKENPKDQRLFQEKCEMDKIANLHILPNYDWQAIEVIAVSNICISMGMTSPSTIANICGVIGLYFDQTENMQHPFRKYRESLVFDKADKLFSAIENHIKSNKKVAGLISEEDLEQFDSYRDHDALERMVAYIANGDLTEES
jgi:hypothetical protein